MDRLYFIIRQIAYLEQAIQWLFARRIVVILILALLSWTLVFGLMQLIW
ncbi:hypothetical protein [uncultured Devosia sp.]